MPSPSPMTCLQGRYYGILLLLRTLQIFFITRIKLIFFNKSQEVFYVISHLVSSHCATHTHSVPTHTHTFCAHTHCAYAHTHSVPTHTHSVPTHTHSLSYAYTHTLCLHTYKLCAHTHTLCAYIHSLCLHTHTLYCMCTMLLMLLSCFSCV